VNPPSFSGAAFTATSRQAPIQAQVTVKNAASWRLVLYASNPGHAPYEKDSDAVRLACGDSQVLRVSYNWTNHPSERWWFKVFRDGAEVYKSPDVVK
jgi:hypothetical protein